MINETMALNGRRREQMAGSELISPFLVRQPGKNVDFNMIDPEDTLMDTGGNEGKKTLIQVRGETDLKNVRQLRDYIKDS
mmetsp:Transcript_13612/g.21299  ORF Transcript_13612/g.21299 Transcript_13612/m.21299 type:complete len:80 (-) Transcript_13612:49-288(-)